MIQQATAAGGQVIVLPECFNSPYSTKYFGEYAEEIPGTPESSPSVHFLLEAARNHQVHIIGGSIPEREGNKLYNTSICVSPDGQILKKHRKVHLFDINVPGKIVFFESDVLTAGNEPTIIETPYCKIGVGICYDLRFGEYAWTLAKSEDVGLLIYPGNFNMTTGPKHWELLLRSRAVDNQIFVAACSQARNTSSEYVSYGYSMVVNPWGEILASTEFDEGLVVQDIDFGVQMKIEAASGQEGIKDLNSMKDN
eukprot:CAMPEP_0202947758 /NCGR_PEP_ID=MMETSP1395-20130829/12123_1 /ASSEMBLY_ACC=CAM_ASM_000871 /TAXON_ID=5961 /ORGANISM="Blepharisma japonicum, Strain Stock R1072" /LENGTH=252 /DNA_ID=CAMNT_0049649255 /DNA_START=75 /DNA_END=831 /DNA_ORIENTATION=+